MKKIKFEEEAQQSLLNGTETLFKAVSSTFGPRGNTVIYQADQNYPKITKDGVTVAKEVRSSDFFEDLSMTSLREVASQTVDRVGDGTTSAIIFAYSLLKYGLEAKLSAFEIDQLKNYSDACVNMLNDIGIEAKKDIELLASVARTSSNGDEEVVTIIKEGLSVLGEDGNFILEESQNKETQIIASDGVYFPVGMTSPFYSNRPMKVSCEYEDPLVLLTDEEVKTWDKLKTLIHRIGKIENTAGRPLVIIVKDISFEAEAGLVAQIKKDPDNYFKFCCIALKKILPHEHEKQCDLFQDLSVVFGGSLVSRNEGLILGATSGQQAATEEHLGTCKKIIVTMDKTIVIPTDEQNIKIASYAAKVKDIADKASEDKERHYHTHRLARMCQGVAVILVGGYSQQSIKEKKDRIEDSICAVQSARKHGVVPGACSTYRKLRIRLDQICEGKSYEVFAKALDNLSRILYKNTNLDPFSMPELMVDDLQTPSSWIGHNLKKMTSEEQNKVNILSDGIVDPLFVPIETIRNSVDVVSLLLQSKTFITYDLEYLRKNQGAIGGY